MGIVLRVEHAPPWNDFTGGNDDEARPVQAQRPAASRTREQVLHAEGWPAALLDESHAVATEAALADGKP